MRNDTINCQCFDDGAKMRVNPVDFEEIGFDGWMDGWTFQSFGKQHSPTPTPDPPLHPLCPPWVKMNIYSQSLPTYQGRAVALEDKAQVVGGSGVRGGPPFLSLFFAKTTRNSRKPYKESTLSVRRH